MLVLWWDDVVEEPLELEIVRVVVGEAVDGLIMDGSIAGLHCTYKILHV